MPDLKEPQFLVCEKIKGRLHKYIDSAAEYYELFREIDRKVCVGEAMSFIYIILRRLYKTLKKS